MATPGLYLLDGDLFVATRAPECYQPGQPGVRMNALRGHFLHKGTWKGSGTVDCDARKVEDVAEEDVARLLIASAPAEVQDMFLNGPPETVEDVLEGLRDPVSGGLVAGDTDDAALDALVVRAFLEADDPDAELAKLGQPDQEPSP